MEDLLRTIGKTIASKLDGYKYQVSNERLIKKTNNGWIAIALDLIKDKRTQTARVDAYAHLRHEKIESIYGLFRARGDARKARNRQTLSKFCLHLFSEGFEYGFSLNDVDIEEFSDRYASELKKSVIPWLEKYSNEEALYIGFLEDDSQNQITSDPLTRFPVLLSMLKIRNDRSKFEEISKEFLDYCNKDHAKVHMELATSIIEGIRDNWNI